MKWNIFVGSMVLGVSLASQSFGFGLLDRMLGGHGCGCASSCCDTSVCEPSCGVEQACADPSCGCEIAACDPCASADPSCGCEMAACDPCASAAPSCGCEMAACDPCAAPSCDSGCKPRCRKPLLGLLKKLHSKKSSCCEPSCGCEVAACDHALLQAVVANKLLAIHVQLQAADVKWQHAIHVQLQAADVKSLLAIHVQMLVTAVVARRSVVAYWLSCSAARSHVHQHVTLAMLAT